MLGMVISMSLGMVIGLSTGSISAILYPDSFFEVTIISMLIGGLIGVISGYPFSLIAVIDGLVSGIMSGMMGTMLGMMILPENQNQLLNIIGLITVGIFFLIFLLIVTEINKEETNTIFFLRPFPYFIFVCLFIISSHAYTFTMNQETTHNHSSHTKNQEIILNVSGYEFTPQQLQVAPNEELTFKLVNNSSVEHDFVIKELDYHLHTMPGTTNKESITFTVAGTYEAICTIPGHKEAGMVATIHVTE
jgi:uncharacterized cupredoxin-like copper-binding protein